MNVLGVYRDVDGAAQGVQGLLGARFRADTVDVMTAVPYPAEVFGLPEPVTNLRKIAPIFWVLGAICGLILAGGSAWDYHLPTGGKPLVSLETCGVIIYEMAMLFGVLATALTTLWELQLPTLKKLPYHPKITEGWLAVTVDCPAEEDARRAEESLRATGAEEVVRHA